MKYTCKCWKKGGLGRGHKPGFDVKAWIETEVKVDENGKYMYIYVGDSCHSRETLDLNAELIKITGMPRCGCCGDYAEEVEE